MGRLGALSLTKICLRYLLLIIVPLTETRCKVASMRQAVVVIHGIGEQRPMDTIRGFVNATMPLPSNPIKPRFWSKPNPMSELFELRKLVTPQSRTMPPTDFYEYYWAYQTQGTKFVHVISWAWILLVRRPKNVPHHLKVLWLTLWFLILSSATLISTSYWGRLVSLGGKAISANQLLAILSSALLLVISGLILNYVGDAARYLNPSPPNIDMRRRIRAEGIETTLSMRNSLRLSRRPCTSWKATERLSPQTRRRSWQTNFEMNNPHCGKNSASKVTLG